MANLLKFYRGAVAPSAPVKVGTIWFDVTNQVIKVCTAAPEGAEATWEVYGTTPADLSALAVRVTTLEGAVKTLNETTLPALEAALKKYADDAVAAEAKLARAAEEALAGRLDVIEGEGEGSIKKAVADAKAELIDDATENGNTLGKLEGLINDVAADAKSYSIAKVTEGLGENVKEAFKLVDEDGTQVGETINIYKDSSLISVDLVDEKPAETEGAEATKGQFIKYTYVLANGTESVQYVDVSRLLVEAEFKNGLEVSAAGEVSVKVDATSEAFLTVGAEGVKLSGVQSAIDTAKGEAIAEIAPAIAALDADVTSAEKYTVTTTAEDGTESTEEVNHKVRVQVVEVDGVVTGVNVTESDIASAEKLAEVELVTSAALNDLNARVEGLAGDLADKNVDAEGDAYVSATAADNKVTVAATESTKASLALADSAVQTVVSDNECLTAVKNGTQVELSLCWMEGSF